MDLEHELLGVYIAEDSQKSTAPKVDLLTKEDRPFYELGKICSIEYMKKPLAVAYSPEMKDIRKKVFGHVCDMVGQSWYEKNEPKFLEYAMNQNLFMITPKKLEKEFKEELTDLFDNIKCAYFTALSEFGIGFWEGATKKTFELTKDIWAPYTELFNGFWKMFGFNMPDETDEFMTLLGKHDLPGMVKLYHDNPVEINNAYAGAGEFIEFVESRMKEQ